MINIVDAELRLGGKTIFSNLNWRIGDGDRVGLVGPNGAGKTSLLRILTGEYELESGVVEKSKNMDIGYLPQESSDCPQQTIHEVLWEAFEPINRMEDEMKRLMKTVESTPNESKEHQKALERYGQLQEQFERNGGYSRESEAKKVIVGLGFSEEDWERDLNEFSGGWRMRVFLAKLLLQKPQMLLLDEPTNHLDTDSLAWFENYMSSMDCGMVIVSHDRFYLDRMVTQIAEIEKGNFKLYHGNYSRYKKQKELDREQLLAQKKNQDKEIAHLEKFIDRFRAKATKAKQAQSRIKRLEKIERIEIEEDSPVVTIPLPTIPRSGKEVLTLDNLGHSYGDVRALKPVSTLLMRGGRVGVWGPNGAGKTTLLALMAEEMEPTEGVVKWGHNVHIAYFSQHHAELQQSEKTLLEEMESVAPDEMRTRVRDVLGCFLFQGDDVMKKVSVCSGGEKSRLALAKLLIRPVNVMILDEPLNHLDISTVEIMEETFKRFEGTLIFVSHDRYFIDRLATQVWVLDRGHVDIYKGNFQDYEYAKRMLEAEKPGPQTGKPSKAVAIDDTNTTEDKGLSREERKEKKRREAEARKKESEAKKEVRQQYQSLEQEILEMEEEIESLEAQLGSPEVAHNGDEMARLSKRYKELLERKEVLYEEWEVLAEQV